jgi:hypothetical protein
MIMPAKSHKRADSGFRDLEHDVHILFISGVKDIRFRDGRAAARVLACSHVPGESTRCRDGYR